MGKRSATNPRCRHGCLLLRVGLLALLFSGFASAQTAPLLLPAGLAYDSQGNLYFSESGKQVVSKLSPAGVLSVLAGTGIQGFAGDGGAASAARLDTPGAVAVDTAGNVVIADTHNHRVRRVDAATGFITTVVGTGNPGPGPDGLAATLTGVDLPSALAYDAAGNLYYADARNHVVRRVDHTSNLVTTIAGNGRQGFQGDGGPALAASLDSPSGLALDADGNLFLSDTHNQRVRRVDARTGTMTSIAGTASAGYSAGAATNSALSLPKGLLADASGNLYLVDSGNHRLRRIDAATGQITTVAGSATEGFAGDGGPATQAALNEPRAIALSNAGLPTLTDTANARIRQVDAAGVIHTLVGVGAVAIAPAGLALTAPPGIVYGGGSVTATISGAAASGSITFLDGTNAIGVAPLSGNTAVLSTALLSAGSHLLSASFAGDSTHPALQSNLLPLSVARAPVLAVPTAVNTVYGVVAPPLTGTLTGVLPQDAAAVQVSFTTTAVSASAAGSYPILATLAGSAAGNYALSTAPAALIIAKAAATVNLTSALLAHLATTTLGQPGGSVTLLDGNVATGTLTADATGNAQFSSAGLSNGSHTLSASYAGDVDFLPAVSAPVLVTIGAGAGGDFSLATTGSASQTITAGSSATFGFTETPVGAALSSPVLLAVSGLPAGATATFSPAYLPPGSNPVSFTLTVQTSKTAGLVWPGTLVFAGLLGLLLLPRRRRLVLSSGFLLCALAGCGDRVSSVGQPGGSSRTYNLTVNATATSNSGATLLHSSALTLTIQ